MSKPYIIAEIASAHEGRPELALQIANYVVSAGADAVYQIARQIKGWEQLAWLYRVPVLHGVFRAAYAWVAKYRYKLAKRCENDICEI